MNLARWRSTLMPALLLLLLGYQCVFAAQVMISDMLDFTVQRVMVFWGVDGYKPSASELESAQTTMARALNLWPQHPDYLALQARLQWWQAQLATSRQATNVQYKLAIATMHKSLEERPGNPYSWAQYAEYLSTQRDRKLEFFVVTEKVAKLGPGDQALQKRMRAMAGN